jgi:hypothetical protein
MNKTLLILLVVSVLLLNFIALVAGHSFMPLYYVLWLGIIGTYFWRNRVRIEEKLVSWNAGSFRKFVSLGIGMILLEEIFAGFSMHLASAKSVSALLIGILQFWAFNLLALPGFIVGWYFLLRRFAYSKREIFILVGIFGLFSEKIYKFVLTSPVMAVLLILPTMFTYMLIITPSVLSFRGGAAKALPGPVRYALGFFVPLIFSIPFVLLLSYLRAQYPFLFPPAGFVS